MLSFYVTLLSLLTIALAAPQDWNNVPCTSTKTQTLTVTGTATASPITTTFYTTTNTTTVNVQTTTTTTTSTVIVSQVSTTSLYPAMYTPIDVGLPGASYGPSKKAKAKKRGECRAPSSSSPSGWQTWTTSSSSTWAPWSDTTCVTSTTTVTTTIPASLSVVSTTITVANTVTITSISTVTDTSTTTSTTFTSTSTVIGACATTNIANYIDGSLITGYGISLQSPSASANINHYSATSAYDCCVQAFNIPYALGYAYQYDQDAGKTPCIISYFTEGCPAQVNGIYQASLGTGGNAHLFSAGNMGCGATYS